MQANPIVLWATLLHRSIKSPTKRTIDHHKALTLTSKAMLDLATYRITSSDLDNIQSIIHSLKNLHYNL